MADIKVAILEKDGVELGVPTEYRMTIFDVLPWDVISEEMTIEETEQLILVSNICITSTLNVNGKLGVV